MEYCFIVIVWEEGQAWVRIGLTIGEFLRGLRLRDIISDVKFAHCKYFHEVIWIEWAEVEPDYLLLGGKEAKVIIPSGMSERNGGGVENGMIVALNPEDKILGYVGSYVGVGDDPADIFKQP